MNHTIHNLTQGSPEWHAHRANCYNASDLVAAAGASSYTTRTDFIRKLATGIEPEIDAATQRRFDDGHRCEELARPLAEEIIGDTLYPISVSLVVEGLSRPLGASLDGAVASDEINFEHKKLNAALAAALDQGIIPAEYHWQMEQGQFINGATRTLFMASNWDENDQLIDAKHCWYESNPELRAKIIPTWQQVENDKDDYQHVEVIPAAVAAPQMALPAVAIQVEGAIALRDNLPAFGLALKDYIAGLNKKPQTDQDFADLDASAKLLREVQVRIAAARDGALGQIASIDTMKRTADVLEELARVTAVEVENLVKAEKANRRAAIIQGGKDGFAEHVAALNEKLGKPYMPQIVADFATAIKGKSKLDNIRDAVDTLLANKKIEADEIADRIEINLNYLRENAKEYPFLFADAGQIVLKANDDFEALAKLRISEHKAEQERKLEAERARIRAEEEARANAAAEAKMKAEQEAADRLAREQREAEQAEFNRQQGIREAEAVRVALAAEAEKNATAAPASASANEGIGETPALGQRETLPAASVQSIQPAAPIDTGARIKLGEICERLAIDGKPLILSADQLAALGFAPVETVKAAKMYREQDFPAICAALARHIQAAVHQIKKVA